MCGLKIPCIKVPKSLQKTRAQLWEWSRIVPCVEISILCEKFFRKSRKTKNAPFLHFYPGLKTRKGGALGIKKFKNCLKSTKLAGLVGSIKKVSWEVILKCACTLLRSERSKKKAATSDLEIIQREDPWDQKI